MNKQELLEKIWNKMLELNSTYNENGFDSDMESVAEQIYNYIDTLIGEF